MCSCILRSRFIFHLWKNPYTPKITKLRAFSPYIWLVKRMYPTTWTKLDLCALFCVCVCLLFFVSCVFRFCLNVLVFLCSCWLLLLLISSSSFSVFHFHRHSFMNYVPVYTPYTEKELTLVHLSAWESTREQNDFNLVNVNVPILACYYWRRFVGPLFSHSVSL